MKSKIREKEGLKQVIHGPFAARFGVPTDKKYYWEVGLEVSHPDPFAPSYHSMWYSSILWPYFDKEDAAHHIWLIEPDNKDIKLYSPLALPSLPQEFARLEPTQEAIKRFADRYGILAHHTILKDPTRENYVKLGESLSFWKREIARMKLVRQLMMWVRRRDIEALSQHIIWEDVGIWEPRIHLEWDSQRTLIGLAKSPHIKYLSAGKPRWRVAPALTDPTSESHYFEWEYGNVVEPARVAIHREINAGLLEHVSPAILPDRPHEIFMLPDCLLSAMYVLLALDITRGTRPPIQCKGCEEYFTPDHGRQAYCTENCRKNHWYHTHKR